MPAAITNWPITLKQFLVLPEAEPALEMGPCGEIKQKVPPSWTHANLQEAVLSVLNAYARPRRLGRAVPELRVVLGDAARVPDVAFYRYARLPRENTIHPTSAPDLVAEIYSPGQEGRRELQEKARWYIEQGVELVLLVDPERRRITSVGSGGRHIHSGDEVLPLEALLPGLRLTPNEVFEALKP
jgi:Uma2 family endonuclease